MSAEPRSTRDRLLHAAADLIAATPDGEVPVRAICDAVGVQAPTLYHHFGDKRGLLDAVVADGFEQYLALKNGGPDQPDDPRDRIRAGWDTHVQFGLDRPNFYALMYGRVGVTSDAPAASTAKRMLRSLVQALALDGRLTVPVHVATDAILAANIGITLALLTQPSSQRDLTASTQTRDAILDWIAPDPASASDGQPGDAGWRPAAITLSTWVGAHSGLPGLSDPEARLLAEWLDRAVGTDGR